MVEIRRSQTPSGRGQNQRRFSEYKRPNHFSMFSNPALFPKQRSPFFPQKPSASPLMETVSDPAVKPGHYRKRNRLQSLSGHFHFGYKWRTDTKQEADKLAKPKGRKRKQSKDDLDVMNHAMNHGVNSKMTYSKALRNAKSDEVRNQHFRAHFDERHRRRSKSMEAEDIGVIEHVIEFMTHSDSESEDDTLTSIRREIDKEIHHELVSPRRSPSPKSVASPTLMPLPMTRKKRRSLSVGNLSLNGNVGNYRGHRTRKRSGFGGVLDVPGIGRSKSAHPPDPKLLQNLSISTDGDVDMLFVRSRSTTRHGMETLPMPSTTLPLAQPLEDSQVVLCDEEEEDVIEQRGATSNRL